MSDELEVLSVEDIEAYINGKNLQDTCHIALSKALAYCQLLIGLYRQTDALATELKANANAARERAAQTTRELTDMRQRTEAALALVPAYAEYYASVVAQGDAPDTFDDWRNGASREFNPYVTHP